MFHQQGFYDCKCYSAGHVSTRPPSRAHGSPMSCDICSLAARSRCVGCAHTDMILGTLWLLLNLESFQGSCRAPLKAFGVDIRQV